MRRFYVPARAVQQAHADLSLEVADQMRYRRPGNAKLRRCAREAALMGNGAKRFDGPERRQRHR